MKVGDLMRCDAGWGFELGLLTKMTDECIYIMWFDTQERYRYGYNPDEPDGLPSYIEVFNESR